MKTTKITKQYIQENLFMKDGRLNQWRTKLLKETNEELYLIFNDVKSHKCICGMETTFIDFKRGYLEFCSVKCSSNSENTKNVRKCTNLEKYGAENVSQVKEFKDKKIETSLINWNVAHPMKLKKFKDKVIQTNVERYEFEHTFQVEEFKEKSKETNLKNLGVDNPFKSRIIQEKSKATRLKNCGFEYPMQSGLYNNSGYKYKDYIYPSGKIVKIQGYENQLLDELLNTYTENEILTDRKDMPEFWYLGNDHEKHRYFPDVYIPKVNLIYEVKSSYTLEKGQINGIYELKKQSVLDAGYNFKLEMF